MSKTCKTCKYKNQLTVLEPCFSCISIEDLILHKSVAETKFTHYEPEEAKAKLESEGK